MNRELVGFGPKSDLDPVAVLLGAAELLEKPGAWTQHAFARDRDGSTCAVSDERACCFCMQGAVNRVIWNKFGGHESSSIRQFTCKSDEMYFIIRNAWRTLHQKNSHLANHINWNDRTVRTQAEVVAELRGIAAAVQAGGVQ